MIGIGNDRHRLEQGKKLILGGIEIDSPIGCVAHSDGDALLHALTDALLGAVSCGDIGDLFPDTDAKYKNADSRIFVEEALRLMRQKGRTIINIDAIIMLQTPKLSGYKSLIKNNIAKICGIRSDQVNVKAKTGEHIGIIGTSQAVETFVAVCIE